MTWCDILFLLVWSGRDGVNLSLCAGFGVVGELGARQQAPECAICCCESWGEQCLLLFVVTTGHDGTKNLRACKDSLNQGGNCLGRRQDE